jgi:hypothetical protein
MIPKASATPSSLEGGMSGAGRAGVLNRKHLSLLRVVYRKADELYRVSSY